MRYLDIHENDVIDEALLTAWEQQANLLPGERMSLPSRAAEKPGMPL